jgi:hypothetical protein
MSTEYLFSTYYYYLLSPLPRFLYRPDSAEYKKYRELVGTLKSERKPSGQTFGKGFNDPQRSLEPDFHHMLGQKRHGSSVSSSGDEEDDKSSSLKRRRSRWGPQSEVQRLPPPGTEFPILQGQGPHGFAPGAPPPPPPMIPPPSIGSPSSKLVISVIWPMLMLA